MPRGTHSRLLIPLHSHPGELAQRCCRNVSRTRCSFGGVYCFSFFFQMHGYHPGPGPMEAQLHAPCRERQDAKPHSPHPQAVLCITLPDTVWLLLRASANTDEPLMVFTQCSNTSPVEQEEVQEAPAPGSVPQHQAQYPSTRLRAPAPG